MYDDLMEQVVAEENLRRALAAVKRNGGAAGIDGMTTDQLESHFNVTAGKSGRSSWREAGRQALCGG